MRVNEFANLCVAIGLPRRPYRGVKATAAHHLDDDDRWAISVAEAGRRLDISRAHAYRLVASGELPSLRLGHRTVVPVWALRALLAEPAQKRLMSSAAGMREPVDTSGASASGRLVRFVGTDESGGGGRSC